MSATCRSCGAEIIWAITRAGNRMPLDATPEPRRRGLFTLHPGAGDTLEADVFNEDEVPLYRSHFATCPNADQHRKRESPSAERERRYHEAVDAE